MLHSTCSFKVCYGDGAFVLAGRRQSVLWCVVFEMEGPQYIGDPILVCEREEMEGNDWFPGVTCFG